MNTLQKIQAHFLRGAPLTVVQCALTYNTADLRHYVSVLNKRGWNVQAPRTKTPSRYANYYMTHSDIKRVKQS